MGHMAFAGDEDAHLYMGAHLLLTGVRGLTVPFLGVFLYNHALGVHLIWISGAAQFVAAVGYWLSARCDSRPAVGKPTPSRAYTP